MSCVQNGSQVSARESGSPIGCLRGSEGYQLGPSDFLMPRHERNAVDDAGRGRFARQRDVIVSCIRIHASCRLKSSQARVQHPSADFQRNLDIQLLRHGNRPRGGRDSAKRTHSDQQAIGLCRCARFRRNRFNNLIVSHMRAPNASAAATGGGTWREFTCS